MTDGKVVLGVELDEKPLHKDLNDLEKEIEATAKIVEDDLKFESEVDTKKSQDDLDNLNKKSKDAADGLDGVGESSGRAVGSVTAIGAAATVAAGGLLLVGDAADTAVGNMDRVESVFGDATVGMEALTAEAEALGNQLGVATQDILMTGASMAVTAENTGMAEDQAEKYGAAVAKLTAVCASYLNIPMEEAAERTTAAMRGEAEAAEALGLSLGQTAMTEFVNQQIEAGAAVNKTYSEMSAQEQMVVRLIAAIDQMANTMGIATPEVYTLASVQAVLAELTSKASEEVTIQQKVTADLKETWNEFLVAIQPVKDALVALIAVFVGLIITIGEAILTNEHFIKIAKAVTAAIFGILVASAALTAITWKTIDAFLDWIATNEKTQKIIETVTKVVVILGASIIVLASIILRAIEVTINWIRTNEELQKLIESVGNAIVLLVGVIGGLIAIVAMAIVHFVEWISQSVILQSALQAIGMILEDVATIINKVITNTKENIAAFKEWASEAELLQSVLEGVENVIEGINNAIEKMIGWINSAIDAFQNFRAQDFGSDLVNMGASANSQSSKSGTSQSAMSTSGLTASGLNMSRFVVNPNAVLSGGTSVGGTVINTNSNNNYNLNFTNKSNSPYEIALEVRRLNRGY